MSNSFAKRLIAWHKQFGRHDLPWQKRKTAYRVYVSEIMLQQTQVSTVIPYYERFMKRFPTVKALAEGPLDDVLALWSGLGYYGRARRLHAAACEIMEKHKGRFPKTLEKITTLPGIGPSTGAAILSFAYNQPETILDGNVKRVLARYYMLPGPVESSAALKVLWAHAKANTPIDDAQTYNQAIMDLGATCCTRTQPKCGECPFQNDCQAFLTDCVDDYPERPKPKKKNPEHEWHLLILRHNDHLLLEKRPTNGIWGGLWHPPQLEDTDLSAIDWLTQQGFPKAAIGENRKKRSFKHLLSHKTLIITPQHVTLTKRKTPKNGTWEWVHIDAISDRGIAKPFERVLKKLTIAQTI